MQEIRQRVNDLNAKRNQAQNELNQAISEEQAKNHKGK